MLLEERLEELKAEFGELDEPFQRYSLLLQLAAYAPQPPCDFTTDEHLFRGCQTKVWLSVRRMDGQPDIRITSDSMLLLSPGGTFPPAWGLPRCLPASANRGSPGCWPRSKSRQN